MTSRGGRGYIFVETLVAMMILSVSTVVIQEAVRQAIIARGEAMDYTTARFLLEKTLSERMLAYDQPEGSGKGTYDAPFERFAYSWEVKRVEIPMPELPTMMTPQDMDYFKANYVKYLGKLSVTVTWSRAGNPFTVTAQTLLPKEMVWMPPDPEGMPI